MRAMIRTDNLYSNAKTGGLEADFHLTSNQYSVILLVFFVSYVIFEIPSNMVSHLQSPACQVSQLTLV